MELTITLIILIIIMYIIKYKLTCNKDKFRSKISEEITKYILLLDEYIELSHIVRYHSRKIEIA